MPKVFVPSPTKRDHALIVPDPEVDDSELIIPLQIKGVTSFLSVHKPTKEQWDHLVYPRMNLTSEHLD